MKLSRCHFHNFMCFFLIKHIWTFNRMLQIPSRSADCHSSQLQASIHLLRSRYIFQTKAAASAKSSQRSWHTQYLTRKVSFQCRAFFSIKRISPRSDSRNPVLVKCSRLAGISLTCLRHIHPRFFPL